MNENLVSVVIPAFNAERYIAAAIESVLAQSYPNLEVIVVDDGSEDGTAGIIDDCADDRVRRIHQRNSGLAAARNRGLSDAKGEFVAFIDADDLWREDKLAKQMPLFEDHNVGCVYSRSCRINENGTEICIHDRPLHRGRILLPLILEDFITVSSVVLRQDLLKTSAISFRPGRQGVEDWDMWLRLAQLTEFDYVDEPLVRHRVHPQGMSQDRDLMFPGIMTVLGAFESAVKGSELYGHLERRRYLRTSGRSRGLEKLRHGHWLLARGRVKEARNMMRQAFRHNPTDIHAWWGLLKSALPVRERP